MNKWVDEPGEPLPQPCPVGVIDQDRPLCRQGLLPHPFCACSTAELLPVLRAQLRSHLLQEAFWNPLCSPIAFPLLSRSPHASYSVSVRAL